MDSTVVSGFRVTNHNYAGSVTRRAALAICIMASHFQIGLSGFQVPMPFGLVWAVAWGGHLRAHGVPALGQTGLWREGAAAAHLEAGCPHLCCGELRGCRGALGRSPRLPHSSILFYRTGGLSLRTVLARSASLGAAD